MVERDGLDVVFGLHLSAPVPQKERTNCVCLSGVANECRSELEELVMKRTRLLMKSAAAFAALGMTLGSTATAATTSFQAVDPLVAVSLFGSAQSSAVAPAAGSQAASVAGQGTPSGALIPASAAASAGQGAEPYYSNGSEIGVLPIIGGLIAIAVIAAILLKSDDDGEIDLPISP
ncbi:MAG TPA: hypothetical protein VJ775_02795 [Sphingomicrobium sp.]|nr:hypothetical protein [Sphingomicrobium sp.]